MNTASSISNRPEPIGANPAEGLRPIALSERAGFSWPAPARDELAQKWREAAVNAMTWLFLDISGGGSEECSSQEKSTTVRHLAQGLMAIGHSERLGCIRYSQHDHYWPGLWRGTAGDPIDQRFVVSFMGKAYAQWCLVDIPEAQRITMVGAHVGLWISKMTSLAWRGAVTPAWMPESILKELEDADGYQDIDPAVENLLRPWIGPDVAGVHEDLVEFLTSFCGAMKNLKISNGMRSIRLAKTIVLLRAVGAAEPHRIPLSTLLLLNEMEEILNMKMMTVLTNFTPEACQIVRAGCERRMLEEAGDPIVNTSATTQAHRRTL